jgi:hypothetical protein
MAPDELKRCNNQPKTRGRDGGGIGYETRPSGNEGGAAIDRFGADELEAGGRI